MLEPERHGIPNGRNEPAPRNGKELASESPSDESINQIGEPIEHHYPHSEEVPLQSVLRPRAERDRIGKPQPAENYIVIINLPPAHDHDDHGSGIDPMHSANRQRMKPQPMASI